MDDAHEQERPADDDELDSVERELKQMLEASDLGGEPKDPAPMLGETIAGTYTLTEPLGEGGMGTVFLAEHARTGGKVAIKLIKASRLGDDNAIRRFELEAKHTASLHHPNIVRVFDYGRDGDLVYLAMEYVPGTSVQELIEERGALDWPVAVEIATQVLKALAAAHDSDQQIIHRDIKPANILVTDEHDETFVKVLDFGIARALEGPSANTQGVIGSPQSMAPEQFDGGPLSPATDLYALGCTMYAMLSGRPPFTGTFSQLALKHCNEQPPALDEQPGTADVPRALLDWVDWLMQKASEDRPDDAPVALKALESVRDGDVNHTAVERTSEQAKTWTRVPLVGGIAIVATVLFLIARSQPDPGARSATEYTGDQDAAPTSADAGVAGAIPVRQPPDVRIIKGVTAKPGHTAEVSRQGNFIAYSTPQTVRVRTLSTGETTEFAIPEQRNVGGFSWFPDGARLLVTLRTGEQSELWTLNLLDKKWERLLPDAHGGTISPDGARIAFGHKNSIQLSTVEGEDVRTVTTFSDTRRLQQFAWFDANTLIVSVRHPKSRGHVIGSLDTKSGNLTTLIRDRRLSIGGPIPFAVLNEDLLLYAWALVQKVGAGSQVRVARLAANASAIEGRPRVLIDGVEDAYWYNRFSTTRDGTIFMQRNRARRWSHVFAVNRDPPQIDEVGTWETISATHWLSEEILVSSTLDDGDTVFTRGAPGSDRRETFGRVDGRAVRLAATGPNRSAFGFEKTSPEAEQKRLVWLEDPLRNPATRVVLAEDLSRDEPASAKCTRQPDPRCFFVRHRPDRIELSRLTPRGIEGEPFVSIAGPAQAATKSFDLRGDSPELIVAYRDEVGFYDMDGARMETWRPEEPGERYYLQSVEWDPHGGFFVSGMFPESTALYQLLHVSPDGEIVELKSSLDRWLLLVEVSPDGDYLSLSSMSWERDVLEMSLPTTIFD